MVLLAILVLSPTDTVWGAMGACQSLPGNDPVSIDIIVTEPDLTERDRSYNVYCPDVLAPPTGAIPLVLAFHGGGGNPINFNNDTEFADFADDAHAISSGLEEFFLVLPAGLDSGPGNLTEWNNRADHLSPPDQDDVVFIEALIEELVSTYDGNVLEGDPPWTIDTSRIYAVGFSAGATMVNRLSMAITDKFAAVANVSGRLAWYYEQLTNFFPDNYVPHLTIFGTGEPLNPGNCSAGDVWFAPYELCQGPPDGRCLNARNKETMEVSATVLRWVEWNKCSTTPTIVGPIDDEADGTMVYIDTYSGCANPAVNVVNYRIEGGGHHWPQGTDVADACPPSQASGIQSEEINGTATVLDFFATHTRSDDADGDGTIDSADNCKLAVNGLVIKDAGGNIQLDTDGDGYGNACDPDITPDGTPAGDCVVNFQDLGDLKDQFFNSSSDPEWNPNADLNGDDFVNFADLGILKDHSFQPPGPSGGTIECDLEPD